MKKVAVSNAVIAGFLITAVTTVILPIILVPAQNRSEYFWVKVLWAEVLFFVAWGFIAWAPQSIYRSSQHGSRQAAIVPGVGVSVFLYVGFSLFFLLSSSLAPDNEWLSRFHLARHVIATAIFLIVSIGLFTIGRNAEPDAATIPSDVKTPEQLAIIMQSEESRITNITGEVAAVKKFAQTYKSLREKISYSLPDISIIGNDPQYADFISKINSLVHSVRNCGSEDMLKQDRLQEQTDYLMSQVDVLASRVKR